jgi:hypothetical protein
MVRSEELLTVVLLVMATSCNRRTEPERATTAATRDSAHELSNKSRNEKMDMAGAARDEAGAPDGPPKEREATIHADLPR